MGKNKKKKNKFKKYQKTSQYDQKILNTMADQFEEYVNAIDTYVIKEEMSESGYQKGIDTVKKLIKKLRKGDESIFENGMYEKAINATRDGNKFESIDYDYY